MSRTRRPIAVLGAGAAGLCAAWELVRRGREVVVLELEAEPGGLCRTVERDGFRFDLGGHRFLSRDQRLVELVRGLLGADLLEAERRSVILLGGRRYAYPLEPLDLVRNLDPALALRGALSYLRRRRSGEPGTDASFRDWTLARYGDVLYELFFAPYTEKLWGIPAAELAGDWAAQRISLLDLSDVALRLLGLRRSETRSYARRYLYPRRGIGQIWSALAAALRARGGELWTGARVTGLGAGGGRVREVRLERGGRPEALACDEVVSTLPLPDLARMLRPRDRGVAAAADALRFRGVRFLNLLLDGIGDVSPNTWMYVPDPRCLFTRIQEPRRRSPESAPAGRTSLMLEIPCQPGDAVWERDDGELTARCLAELDLLGIRVGGALAGSFSTRVVHGYPLFRLGYERHRARLLAAVGDFANLVSCGRQGTFRYLFMDTAMEMGLEAARQVAERQREPARIFSLHDEPALLEARALSA